MLTYTNLLFDKHVQEGTKRQPQGERLLLFLCMKWLRYLKFVATVGGGYRHVDNHHTRTCMRGLSWRKLFPRSFPIESLVFYQCMRKWKLCRWNTSYQVQICCRLRLVWSHHVESSLARPVRFRHHTSATWPPHRQCLFCPLKSSRKKVTGKNIYIYISQRSLS